MLVTKIKQTNNFINKLPKIQLALKPLYSVIVNGVKRSIM